MTQDNVKDFFVSYTSTDRAWAEWIAWQLEAGGYTTILQAWDFRPGSNFVLEMQKAASGATRTIAVLSPKYLEALYTQPEWAAAFKQDPRGQQGTLLPIRVHACKPAGLLAPIVYIDLVDLDESVAHTTLLAGISRSRARPSTAPSYPGNASPASPAPAQPASFPGAWPSIWNVPYRRNPFFTGRDRLLTLLHDKLSTTRATALTQAQAISGLGGIGKTQTAIEYAHRYQKEYRFVLWVSAATPESLLADVVKLATLLDVPGQDAQDQNITVAAVKRWLTEQRDWLLILDNADDVAMVRDFLPGGSTMSGHLLLTTRAQATGGFAHTIEVEKMDKQEGTLLLLRRARVLEEGAELDQATEEHRANAETIVAAVEGLPLALDQAGAYIEEMGCGLADYLGLYQARRGALLGRRGRLSSDHPESVATTWSLSFQQVEQANRAAAELLRLCAFLAPDAIPEKIITVGAPDLGKVLGPVAADAFKLDEALEVVRRYSLLRRNAQAKTLSMHRLVQAVLKDGMNTRTQRLWADRAVRAVNDVFPYVDYETWAQCERYLPHVEACTELIDHYGLAFPEAGRLLHQAAYYLRERARYQQAEPLYQRALRIYEQMEGPEHPSTATTLHELARLYYNQGQYQQAEPLYQRALRIYEQVEGPDHPRTGETLHELARLYYNQGQYQQAEPLYQRALRIHEQVLGPEHPNTASTLHELARLYQDQGQYQQAEPLYQRALRIHAQVEGPEHPNTATTLHALASLYQVQGQYQQAEPILQRALRIYEKVLGPEHPNTTRGRRDYANLLRQMKQKG